MSQAPAEMLKVRVAAQAGALLLAALVCVLALRPFSVLAPGQPGNVGHAVSVSVEMRAPPHTQPRPPPERRIETRGGAVADEEPASGESANGEGMRLWLDGAATRIVFENPAHYRRCLEAAIAHVAAPNCPDPPQGQALTAENSAAQSLHIDRVRPRRPHN